MNISQHIKTTLQEQGRSQRWLALKTGMNEKTLSGRFTRDNFSAADLVLIGEALDIDLNVFKGLITFDGAQSNLNDLKGHNLRVNYDVSKVYEEAIDKADYNSVVGLITQYMPDLNKRNHSALASVIIYMIECDISFEDFVCIFDAEYMTLEEYLDNSYWFYPGIVTESTFLEFANLQPNSELITNAPRIFNEQGCLVFNSPPFVKFEGNKISYDPTPDN